MAARANLIFIVAVGADQVPDLVEDIIEKDAAHAVMLIAGGFRETLTAGIGPNGSWRRSVQARIRPDTDGGPVFIGANCMGVISLPGSTMHLVYSKEKLPKSGSYPRSCCKSCLISQSGALCCTAAPVPPIGAGLYDLHG